MESTRQNDTTRSSPRILVDADACPVKQEVYRVAERYQWEVILVANSWMRIPDKSWLTLEVVDDTFDAADHWIVEQTREHDIVVTADIPLADRCLQKGSHALSPTGKPFTEDSIGQTLATRNLLSELREGGHVSGGPAPLQQRDRSYFLQQLDQVIQKSRRKALSRARTAPGPT